MTPLLSWMLLLTVGALGAAFAIAFARWFDGAADRQWFAGMDEWRDMCAALEPDDFEEDAYELHALPYDWDDQPHDVADEQPHRGE